MSCLWSQPSLLWHLERRSSSFTYGDIIEPTAYNETTGDGYNSIRLVESPTDRQKVNTFLERCKATGVDTPTLCRTHLEVALAAMDMKTSAPDDTLLDRLHTAIAYGTEWDSLRGSNDKIDRFTLRRRGSCRYLRYNHGGCQASFWIYALYLIVIIERWNKAARSVWLFLGSKVIMGKVTPHWRVVRSSRQYWK
ncbi:hypothetical protein ASPBRDRAFT_27406 [Aspergillus brasiliensis CBS 101740]|uniref:Uncharacterized protein n=1 Tax=Aspergillus brasiliensis (strain CBS 101740 / IMI 381727 / IBT 21946) TaxID=767769 RepID=A0A1L9URP9_ASPBC|nr:hypothetical protein ASPBRDRAFT_27406 [Aspergillus brasiliensis CBS 101740]